MKILCDCDGVLLDILGAIHTRNSNFKPSKVVDYDFSTEVYGITREEVLKYLGEYRTFELEKPYRGAKEGVTQLLSLGTVIGYTKVPKDVESLREFQLRKFGIRDSLIYTDGDKLQVHGVDCIIDDCVEVLDKYRDNGIIRIIIDRPYNRSDKYSEEMLSGIYRVKNVMEAYELLKKIKK